MTWFWIRTRNSWCTGLVEGIRGHDGGGAELASYAPWKGEGIGNGALSREKVMEGVYKGVKHDVTYVTQKCPKCPLLSAFYGFKKCPKMSPMSLKQLASLLQIDLRQTSFGR